MGRLIGGAYDAFFEGGLMGTDVTWNRNPDYSLFLSGDLTIAAGTTLWWRGIFVRNAGTATLEHCTAVYGGHWENLILHKTGSGSLTLKRSTIGHSDDFGIYLDSGGPVNLVSSTITSNNHDLLES